MICYIRDIRKKTTDWESISHGHIGTLDILRGDKLFQGLRKPGHNIQGQIGEHWDVWKKVIFSGQSTSTAILTPSWFFYHLWLVANTFFSTDNIKELTERHAKGSLHRMLLDTPPCLWRWSHSPRTTFLWVTFFADGFFRFFVLSSVLASLGEWVTFLKGKIRNTQILYRSAYNFGCVLSKCRTYGGFWSVIARTSPLFPLAGFVIFGSFRISLRFSVITPLKGHAFNGLGFAKARAFRRRWDGNQLSAALISSTTWKRGIWSQQKLKNLPTQCFKSTLWHWVKKVRVLSEWLM
jgi:hypothetical protein